MKYIIVVILSLNVLQLYSQDGTEGTAVAGSMQKMDNVITTSDQIELLTPLDSVNYFVGLTMGYSLEGATFKTDPALIAVGLFTAMAGNPTHSMEEAQEIVLRINQRLMDEKLASAHSIYDETIQKGKAFLEENSKKDGIQTTQSGLQYEIIIQGEGPVPSATDTVNVHYEGMFINGEVFDSSFERGNPTAFPLPMVIAGWREGLQLMPVGSIYKFYIPSELAYGARSVGPIPPHSVLIFRISLLGIQ
jgi:FKBP-type peptidyl-prolyl cis-trans isomerase FkpA